MKNGEFSFYHLEEPEITCIRFPWQKKKPTFNFKELVENFFPSTFYLAFSKQKKNPDFSINWRDIFLAATSAFEKQFSRCLQKILTTAIQGDVYNFHTLLKELPERELNVFFSPLSIEYWFKVIARCKKSILDVLYQYIKIHYKNNLFLPAESSLHKTLYWSLLDWAVACQQTQEVAKLTSKNHIKKLYGIDDTSLVTENIYLSRLIITQQIAAAYSDPVTVNILINKINGFLAIRTKSPPPLWHACLNENIEMISFLISKNQDPNESSNQYPPVATRIAQSENYIAAFNELLKHNIDVNMKHEAKANLSIVTLATTVKTGTLGLILEHYQSNNLDISDEILEQALVLAAHNDYIENVHMLLEANVNPNIPHYQKILEQQSSSKKLILNMLPIAKAIQNNNANMIKLLITYGAQLPPALSDALNSPWFNNFLIFTENTIQEAINKIAKNCINDAENNNYKDNNFIQSWLHNVTSMPVTTWDDLLKTMNVALVNAKKYSISLSQHCISQFKQAMQYVDIKVLIEKNKISQFNMTISNNNNVSFNT